MRGYLTSANGSLSPSMTIWFDLPTLIRFSHQKSTLPVNLQPTGPKQITAWRSRFVVLARLESELTSTVQINWRYGE